MFTKPRLILVAMGIAALAVLSLGLQAQEKGQNRDDIITSEQQLARQFAEFQDALLRLKQRLARGTPEEKKRAEVLDSVIEECKNLAINQEFTRMIEVLRTANIENTGDLAKLKDQSDSLSNRLTKVLSMLRDTKSDRLSEERKQLEKIIKEIERNIIQQQQVQAQTQRDKTDTKDLKAAQEGTTQKTKEIEKAIKKYIDPNANDKTDAANLKGENKDAGKNKGDKGEAKDSGAPKAEGAKGESKDAGKDSKGAKGEAKAGQEAKPGSPGGDDKEPKAGAKGSEKSGADPKEAGAKGEQKGDQKGKEGASKDNKGGDPKSGKGQEGASKDAGAKSGDPKEGQQGAAKGNEDKKAGGEKGPPSSAKPGGEKSDPMAGGAKKSEGGEKAGGDAKGGDAKPSPMGGDPKAGDAKSGDAKSGDAKGNPSPGGGDPMGGAPPQAGQKGDNSPPPPGGSPKAGDKDDVNNAKKKIIEAGYDQAKAEDNIDKKDKKSAEKNQADAIKNMQDAKKKLENLLRQMREEEIERVLAALQARCEKMLMMQQQVLDGTVDLDKVIARNTDKKPDALNKRASLKLADQEKDIVQEANKCIDILEAEGSAVAFPEVFQQIRQDMIHVQKRLELTDTAVVTQTIERDIVDTLKEMIDALKKARQDNQADPGKPGQPGKSGQPGDQKLLELLQELKMVRSLQKRVNDRTTNYGKLFPNQEQARDPQVVRELRSLSDRQLRIQEIVSRIAKGDNK